MKVQLSTTVSCRPKSIQETRYHNTSSLSFKGGSTLAILVAKVGSSAIKGRKRVKYIEELQTLLKSSSTDDYIKVVAALCKTPDSFYDHAHQGITELADFFTLFRKGAQDLHYIPELRFETLKRIDEIPEKSFAHIQLKKELINSFFDNGHEISCLLVDKFTNLNDSIYSTFKVEVLDKCFSSLTYNQKRKRRLDINTRSFLYDYEIANSPCEKDMLRVCDKVGIAYNNLKMLSTLDKNKYKNYYSRIGNLIEYNKQILRDNDCIDYSNSFTQGYTQRTHKCIEKLLRQL